MQTVIQKKIIQTYQSEFTALQRYCMRIGVREDDTADLVQEMFSIAWEKHHQLQDSNKLYSWLKTILRNLCFKRGHGYRQEPMTSLQDCQIEELSCHNFNRLESLVELRDIRRQLQRQFKAKVCHVAELYYFQSKTVKDIASQTNTPSNTILSHIHRTRQYLRNTYNQSCATV